jgi:Tat protein secretion system quality control protein TatD with DNase activity
MALIYDDPTLAALTMTRIAAEESEGPTELTGRMHTVLDDLVQRNGPEYLAKLVIVLARARFIALDDLARATGTNTAQLLDQAEVEALEGLDDGL